MKIFKLKKMFVAAIFAVLCMGCSDLQKADIAAEKKAVESAYLCPQMYETADFAEFKDGKIFASNESSAKEYDVLFKTKPVKFKPNTHYVFNMLSDVKSLKGKSRLQIFIWKVVPGKKPELVMDISQHDSDGEFLPRRAEFFTGDGDANFKISFNAAGKISAKVKDIEIKEGKIETFYAATKNPKPYKLNRKTLPTGARDFVVDMPNNPKGATVNAADFGVKAGEKDLITKLNNAIAHCKKIGAAKLVLDRGTYYFDEEKSVEMKGISDFEFDGGGSTFVYYKTNGKVNNMNIQNCQRIKVHNFNMDWDWQKSPLASIVKLVAINDKGKDKYVDFEFTEYDDFPKKDCKIINLSLYNEKTQTVGMEGSFDVYYDFGVGNEVIVPKKEWLKGNLLRLHLPKIHKKYRVGQFFRMQHYYYTMGGIHMKNNRHLTLENVNIWSCCGFALAVYDYQQYWQFKNVNIVKPKNAYRRAITCTADHCNISNTLGFFKMENCEISFGADDCINFNDKSAYATRKDDYTLQTRGMMGFTKSAYNKGANVELRHDDFSPANYTGRIVDRKEIDAKKGIYLLCFDRKLPKAKNTGFVLFNRNFGTRNMIVRNCYFHDNRARGVIIECSDVTLENCRFKHNEHGAMKIESGYTNHLWSEGFGANNIVIRNCTFEDGCPDGVVDYKKARDIFIGSYSRRNSFQYQTMYPIVDGLLFENNTFIDTYGVMATVSSAGNVVFANNTFIAKTPRKNEKDYRGSIFVAFASNVKVVNNTWVESPLVKTPGVFVDKDKVKGFVFEGNRLVKP